MNGTENNPPRSRWRDFVNRREPAALRVLGLLVLLAAAEVALMLWGPGPAKSPRFASYPLVLTLAAILASPWWSLPAAPAYPDPRWEVPSKAWRWIWLIAGSIAILAMWPRSARLNHSFNSDEVDRLQTAYRFSRENPSPEGDAKAEPTGRRRLVWDFVAAQFAADPLQQTLRNPASIDERAARTLPWAAGLITVGLVVLLAAALGNPRAGLGAGLILALHPEHVRWSSEVADTSLLLLCFASALLFLLNAVRTNRWRWWLVLGAAEALLLTNAAGFVSLLLMNGAAAVVILKSPAARRDRISHLLRLTVALSIAFSAAMVPHTYVLTPFQPPPSFADVIDSWTVLLCGAPRTGKGTELVGSAVLLEMLRETAWRGPALFVLLPALLLAGLYFMLRQDWRTRFVAAMFLIFALSAPGYHSNGPALLLLPLVMAWAGAGLIRLFPRQPRLVHAPAFIAAVYVLTTSPILQRMISVQLQPVRDVTTAARRGTGKEATSATFGRDATLATAYDPAVRVIGTVAEVSALIDAAYAQNRPLFVYHSMEPDKNGEWAPLREELSMSGRFRLIKEFPAFDPSHNYRLYQYHPREQIIRLNLKPEEK